MERSEGSDANALHLSIGAVIVDEALAVVHIFDVRCGFDMSVGMVEVMSYMLTVVGVGEGDPGADDGGDIFEDAVDLLEVRGHGSEPLARVFDGVEAIFYWVKAAGVLAVELKAELLVEEGAHVVDGATVAANGEEGRAGRFDLFLDIANFLEDVSLVEGTEFSVVF